jgi:hypothetical protein
MATPGAFPTGSGLFPRSESSEMTKMNQSVKLPELKSADNWFQWNMSVQIYLQTVQLPDVHEKEPDTITSAYVCAKIMIFQLIGPSIISTIASQGWNPVKESIKQTYERIQRQLQNILYVQVGSLFQQLTTMTAEDYPTMLKAFEDYHNK